MFFPYRVEGGELFDRVVEAGQFPEPLAKLLFYQMVVAIKVSCQNIYQALIEIYELCHGHF